MYMCLKNDIAMVLEGTAGYMCIEKAIAEILRRREPSMCIEEPIEVALWNARALGYLYVQ